MAGDYPKLPSWAAGPTYRAIPGVAAATPVATVSFDLGRTIRSGTLVGVDPAGLAAVAAGSQRRVRGRRDERRAGRARLGRRRGARGADPGRHEAARDRRLRPASRRRRPTRRPARVSGIAPLPPGAPGLSAAVVLRDGDGRVFRTRAAEGSLAGDRPAAGRGPDGSGRAGTGADDARSPSWASSSILLPPGFDPMSGSAELLAGPGDGRGERRRRLVARGGQRRDDRLALGPDRRRARRSRTRRPPSARTSSRPAGARRSSRPRTAAPGSGWPPAPERPPPAMTRPSRSSPPTRSSPSRACPSATRSGSRALGRPFAVRIAGRRPASPRSIPASRSSSRPRDGRPGAVRAPPATVQQADEWWLRIDPGAEPAVLAALRGAGSRTRRSVIGRDELTHEPDARTPCRSG